MKMMSTLPSGTAVEPVLRAEQIDKRFPGVHALDHVDLEVYSGEVHVLLGENGAGKSTLMKILCGGLRPDSGHIWIQGQRLAYLTPEQAQALGIGLVYQEFSLVPTLSVAENILMGVLPRTRFGIVDWFQAEVRAQQALNTLGVSLDLHAKVGDLDVAEQQLTEIARVIAKRPRILLLDEPTSALSDAERERLFQVIQTLQDQGVAIVYITHRLAEVFRIGQRVTVLRDGTRVATLLVAETREEELIEMMVGRRLDEQFPRHESRPNGVLLRVDHLAMPPRLHDVSFTLRGGEILGVFGLMGAGQSEIARALFGLESGALGEIAVNGEVVSIQEPAEAIRLGIGFVPRDRRQGLVPMLPIPPNITLGLLSQAGLVQRLDLATERQLARRYIQELRIQPPLLDRPVLFLSGGNQQKVVLARWLSAQVRILILDDPTRGIDVGAKAEVFQLLSELAQRGMAILFISSEMQELLGMADRILVLRDGRVTAEFQHGQATQEDLLRYAS